MIYFPKILDGGVFPRKNLKNLENVKCNHGGNLYIKNIISIL